MKTHICSITFFFFGNISVHEITWKNFVEPDMPHMTVLDI